MSLRNRRGHRALESAGGVADTCEDEPSVVNNPVIGDSACDNESSATSNVKNDNKPCFKKAEIYTLDAIAAHRISAPFRDDVSQSESASVSDETPPSTPSTPAPAKQSFEIRRRRRSLQDSRVSSSSSPARGSRHYVVFGVHVCRNRGFNIA
jgi:hypothetical protein